MEGNNEGLSERLIMVRDHFNYNNTEFAKVCGFSSSAMDSLLKGTNKDTKTTYVGNISIKLGINLNWLINGEGEMFKEGASSSNNNILTSYNSKNKDIVQNQGGKHAYQKQNDDSSNSLEIIIESLKNEKSSLEKENEFLKKQLEFVNGLLDKAMSK